MKKMALFSNKTKSLFSKPQKDGEEDEKLYSPAHIDVETTPKLYRSKCVQCGKKFGIWSNDEISMYRVVKPEFEAPPPKDTICPICEKIAKVIVEIKRIEGEIDTMSYLSSVKGYTEQQQKEVGDLKKLNKGLKEELVRLKRHLSSGEL